MHENTLAVGHILYIFYKCRPHPWHFEIGSRSCVGNFMVNSLFGCVRRRVPGSDLHKEPPTRHHCVGADAR